MRLMIRAATVTISLALAAVAAAATAQPAAEAGTAPAADDARAKLMAADTDKDGKWSKAEWIAAGRRERGFDFCNTDKDAFIDAAEIKACAERARAMGIGRR